MPLPVTVRSPPEHAHWTLLVVPPFTLALFASYAYEQSTPAVVVVVPLHAAPPLLEPELDPEPEPPPELEVPPSPAPPSPTVSSPGAPPSPPVTPKLLPPHARNPAAMPIEET